MIYRWSTPDPMAVDLQFSGASPPSLIIAGDGGSRVETRVVGVPAGYGTNTGGAWDLVAASSSNAVGPVDVDGTPVVIESMHSGYMATVAVTTDGRLVTVAPFGPTLTALAHPGRVTDVATRLAPLTGPRMTAGLGLELWAAGFDHTDGSDVPVVWQTTGLDALDGVITGAPSTAVVVTGSAGATGPALVGVDGATSAPGSGPSRVYALLPEIDGTSRLWIIQDSDHGAPGPTHLRFRDPTALAVSGGAVWVGDADGLHRVGLAEPDLASTTVWETPVRAIRESSDQRLLALDVDGQVIRPDETSTDVIWEDPAAIDFTVAFDQLVILHRTDNEIVVLDPAVLTSA